MPRYRVHTRSDGKPSAFAVDADSERSAIEQVAQPGRQVLRVERLPEPPPVQPPPPPPQSRLLTHPVDTIAKGVFVGWVGGALFVYTFLRILQITGLIHLF